MPRLEGKRSNSGLYIVLLIVVLLVVLLVLEYLGAINLIQGFGQA
jgi:predicted nucleic acid-binding Zn ribbon protein